jgi:excisionase family DNA binding protein
MIHKEIPINDYELLNKSLLRAHEVAAFFSVHVKTVYRWCEEGELKGVKIQRALRIYRDSIIAVLDKSGTDPT